MLVPVLSTGLVGVASSGVPLVGPGHASVLSTPQGSLRMVWHASIGENCDRYAFVSDLSIGNDAWPYVDLY
jgi:hypothetical protein